jgi:cell wall-associated NlpC family hydrolase
MAQSMFDIRDLIGIPFERAGRGPDTYDCYGLVMELLRRDGVENVPEYNRAPRHPRQVAGVIDEVRPDWSQCEKRPGCVILFRIKGYGAHVGYLLADGRRFVHTWEESGGVMIEKLDTWKNLVLGFYELKG